MFDKWNELCEELKNDKVVAYKSDTVASIYASLKHNNELKEIKKREDDKPFILLVSSLEMLMKYISKEYDVSFIKKQIRKHLGATIIYKSNKNISSDLTLGGTVAIRIPLKKELRTVIDKIGEAILSSSLNSKGEKIKDKRITYIQGYEIETKSRPSRIYSLVEDKYLR